jgi:hypothetical protein
MTYETTILPHVPQGCEKYILSHSKGVFRENGAENVYTHTHTHKSRSTGNWRKKAQKASLTYALYQI